MLQMSQLRFNQKRMLRLSKHYLARNGEQMLRLSKHYFGRKQILRISEHHLAPRRLLRLSKHHPARKRILQLTRHPPRTDTNPSTLEVSRVARKRSFDSRSIPPPKNKYFGKHHAAGGEFFDSRSINQPGNESFNSWIAAIRHSRRTPQVPAQLSVREADDPGTAGGTAACA
jgi:hypothetical protein